MAYSQKKYDGSVILLTTTGRMSDDRKNEKPQTVEFASPERVQISSKESIHEESSKEIYDFLWNVRNGGDLVNNNINDDNLSEWLKSEWRQGQETIYVYMTVPPDGGWGWVVVGISFCCTAIIDGICLCFGRIIPSLTDSLQIDISKVITISSVMNGVYFLVGPVVSAIVNKFGFRVVAMAGGLVSAVAILAGSYCTHWISLTLLYGFLSGWGFGMIFSPATIAVGYYFEKYRALATGLAICGSGFGTLIFSPIFGMVLEKYGWRVTLRLQMALCLFVAAISFLFRPVKPTRVAQIKEPEPSISSYYESEQSIELNFASYSEFLPTRKQESIAEEPVTDVPGFEPTNQIIQQLKKYDPNDRKSRIEKFFANIWYRIRHLGRKPPLPRQPSKAEDELNLVLESPPLFRRDIFYTGSMKDLPNDHANVGRSKSILQPVPEKSEKDVIRHTMSSLHPELAKKPKKRTKLIPPAIYQGFVLLFDFRLFTYPTFTLLVFVCFFYIIGTNIPFIFITSRGEDNLIDKGYTNWFLSVIGVSNTLFRMLAGFVSFVPKADPIYVSSIALLTAGVFTFLSGFVFQGSVAFQFFYCMIFGMGAGIFNTLKQIIFIRCLGLDKLTNVFGITSLVMGVGTLIGMPVAGILTDLTGNSNATFIYSGASIMLASLLQMLVPLALKCQRRREDAKLAREKEERNRINHEHRRTRKAGTAYK